MTKLLPLGANVLVKPAPKQNQTKSGIFIADPGQGEAPQMGVVECIGEEVKTVNIGDNVLFKKYSPDEVEVDLETWLIIAIEDILAIIKDE